MDTEGRRRCTQAHCTAGVDTTKSCVTGTYPGTPAHTNKEAVPFCYIRLRSDRTMGMLLPRRACDQQTGSVCVGKTHPNAQCHAHGQGLANLHHGNVGRCAQLHDKVWALWKRTCKSAMKVQPRWWHCSSQLHTSEAMLVLDSQLRLAKNVCRPAMRPPVWLVLPFAPRGVGYMAFNTSCNA